jgi:hypothetical protein
MPQTQPDQLDELGPGYALEPCPFCASYAVEVVRRKRAWEIDCGNCHVTVMPPAWHRANEIEAALFWNRSRRSALYLVSEGTK